MIDHPLRAAMAPLEPFARTGHWFQHGNSPLYVMDEKGEAIARFYEKSHAKMVVAAQNDSLNFLLGVCAALDELEAANCEIERLKAKLDRAADVARATFDDRPRSREGYQYQDGYDDGTKAAAAAVRALKGKP
jgi:hypothetical protein